MYNHYIGYDSTRPSTSKQEAHREGAIYIGSLRDRGEEPCHSVNHAVADDLVKPVLGRVEPRRVMGHGHVHRVEHGRRDHAKV